MNQEQLANLPDDEYLSRAEIAHLHGILSGQLAGLLSHSREAIGNLHEVREVEADELDFTSAELERDATLRMADRERQLLSKIQNALNRIQEGEYGTCETCGAPITYRRLLARPVATQCIDCKTAAEQIERRSRML
jgi:DnaK suppressor protein